MLQKTSEKGQMLIALIVVLLLIASFLFVGGFGKVKSHIAVGDPIGDLTSNSNVTEANLQLQTLKPKPVLCHHEDGIQADATCQCHSKDGEWKVLCQNKKCITASPNDGPTKPCTDYIGVNPGNDPRGDTYTQLNNLICQSAHYAPTDGLYCVAKPVIYLYPKVDTLVDVSVQTAGNIVVSDPLYPQEGWKNVLAKLSGELTYQGKNYSELFYESEVNSFQKPTNGIIIPTNSLDTKLKNIIYRLGLNNAESQEFLDFWLPKLKNLNSNYILFSVVDKNAKEAIDKVTVEPKPDTSIEFIAYFKPLDFPIAVAPLKLPTRPERIGFTEVEWGGSIDSH